MDGNNQTAAPQGVLENMLNRIETLERFAQQLAAGGGQVQQAQQAQQGFQQPQPQAQQFAPQPQQGQQFAPQPQPQQGQITADMITNLVTPLVADPAVKAALTAQMQAMGLNGLQEAQPHQYAELYARFQSVAAQVQQAQQYAPQAPAQQFAPQPGQFAPQPQQPVHQPSII